MGGTVQAKDEIFYAIPQTDMEKRRQSLLSTGSLNFPYCPICNSRTKKTFMGVFCEDFSIDSNGDCFWHCYSDGTNYWTTTYNILKKIKFRIFETP